MATAGPTNEDMAEPPPAETMTAREPWRVVHHTRPSHLRLGVHGLPADPRKGMFQAVAPPMVSDYTGQANQEFSRGCERYQDYGVRCTSVRGSTFQLADDGTFELQEQYAPTEIVYVNGTMGGIRPCTREDAAYTYWPCLSVLTRGL